MKDTCILTDTGIMFQSAPLREGRCGLIQSSEVPGMFQSAPLREGR